MSAFGLAAFRSLARAFCFACASRELFAGETVSLTLRGQSSQDLTV